MLRRYKAQEKKLKVELSARMIRFRTRSRAGFPLTRSVSPRGNSMPSEGGTVAKPKLYADSLAVPLPASQHSTTITHSNRREKERRKEKATAFSFLPERRSLRARLRDAERAAGDKREQDS